MLLPNCPALLYPQDASVLSEHNTKLCDPPQAIPVTVLPASTPLRSTNTGVVAPTAVPLPNWPFELAPQAARLPSAHKARLELPPLAMATTALPPSTPA